MRGQWIIKEVYFEDGFPKIIRDLKPETPYTTLTEREESAGKPTNSEAQLPNGKAMTDRELMDKAWDYLASYTVGERPNASEVNNLIFLLEARLTEKNT